MVERLRALLGRPMDPALSRAVVLLACSMSAGLAVLVVLGSLGHSAPSPVTEDRVPGQLRSAPTGPATESLRPTIARQDPQDRPGSPAAGRARRELATHRALQHVPWRDGGVAIDLVGASGGQAVLMVKAPSISAARRGYRVFLRRFRDDGHSYLPRFATGRAG